VDFENEIASLWAAQKGIR